ncbi:MAG: PilZ domain-containing protein [Pseudomonadota bacterium]
MGRTRFGKAGAKGKIDLSRAVGTPDDAPQSTLSPVQSKHPRAPRSETWAVLSAKFQTGEVREGVIVNLSKTGARIRFHTRAAVPAKMIIKCPRYRLHRPARLVWQSGFDIGVQFFDPSVVRS